MITDDIKNIFRPFWFLPIFAFILFYSWRNCLVMRHARKIFESPYIPPSIFFRNIPKVYRNSKLNSKQKTVPRSKSACESKFHLCLFYLSFFHRQTRKKRLSRVQLYSPVGYRIDSFCSHIDLPLIVWNYLTQVFIKTKLSLFITLSMGSPL